MAGIDGNGREGGAVSTALSAVQALGRGFDVTCDMRLLYCKGVAGTRVLTITDEVNRCDLEFPGGFRIPGVLSDVHVRDEKPSRNTIGFLDFDEMSKLFNKKAGLPGKTPLGMFNAMFSFSGSWQVDSLQVKGLGVDGWLIPLYSVYLEPPFILCEEVKKAVPTTWDPAALASFIEKHGTHVIISVEVGGKDAIYVKQHQSSTSTKHEMEGLLHDLVEARLEGRENNTLDKNDRIVITSPKSRHQPLPTDGSPSLAGKEDVTVIYRRRGGNDLIQDHGKWRKTIKSNPDVLSMSFLSITSLLERGPAQENLECAVEAYLTYKPPLEELRYFFEFRIPRVWAPVVNQVGSSRKEPVCPSLQFSLMGPKLFISTEQVSVGRKPVTGLRLCLEGVKLNRLAVHVQHLSMLPKILEPHWNPYVPIGAPKWHGPEEQDSRWFEPLRWKSFAHISTAPVEFNETWLGDASGAYIVTGAQLGVWDFGLKSVLHLKLLYSKVPGCTIRRSVWEHSPEPLGQQLPLPKSKADANLSSSATATTTHVAQKLSKFVDTTELMRGPENLPGHWLVTGAKLCVEKSQIFLRVKYSLLNY